jgi:hypothetical protein
MQAQHEYLCIQVVSQNSVRFCKFLLCENDNNKKIKTMQITDGLYLIIKACFGLRRLKS